VEYTGADFTGSDKERNRTLTTSSPKIVAIDNSILHPTADYTYAGGTLTIKIRLADTQNVTIWK